MVDYSEEQQVEIIRKWWVENGVSVIVAIVVAVAALLSWRQWQANQADSAIAASTLYQQMLEAFDAARAKPDSLEESLTVKLSAEKIIEEYPSSAYADYAQLMLAKLAVEKLEYDEAAKQLQAVIDDSASDTVHWTAVMRLARLQVQQAEYDKALALIGGKIPDAYQGQVLELRGDILRAQADNDGARQAYESAIDNMQGDAHAELVRMKLQDLAPVL